MQKDIDRGSAQILPVNEKNRSLLPLDFELSDYGLTKWLKRRGITKYKGLVNAAIKTYHLWTDASVRKILENPAYIGNLALQRRTSVSFKNHKAVYRPEEEWIVTENAHPAIISKELWRRVKEVEKSVSQGKKLEKDILIHFQGFCIVLIVAGK